MNEPLDELYFVWLCGQVTDVEIKNASRTYWKLFRQLYSKEFFWLIPNDDNRMEDGKDLRRQFANEHGLGEPDPEWMRLGCSVLELMVGLSRRLAFEAEGEPHYWFWDLMKNLGLERYNDRRKIPNQTIDATLDQVIWRTYSPSGEGGFFPLKHPSENQRNVELWYQLSAYVDELS